MAKQAKLTDGALRALEALRNAPADITMAELNETLETPIASAHLTALARRGLVSSIDVEREVVRIQKVKAYTLTEDGTNYEDVSEQPDIQE